MGLDAGGDIVQQTEHQPVRLVQARIQRGFRIQPARGDLLSNAPSFNVVLKDRFPELVW